LQHLKPVT